MRRLIEFTMRSGDINVGAAGIVSLSGGAELMAEGSRLHRKIQKSANRDLKAAGEEYRAEVRLETLRQFEDVTLEVIGVADGIIINGGEVIIDEIKTVYTPIEYIDEDYNRLHWAQAECYAYIYCLDNALNTITVRLTYYNREDGSVKYIPKIYDFEDLKEFFYTLTDKYHKWAKWEYEHLRDRNNSIEALQFPFTEYRRGQRELAAGVFRAVRDKEILLALAPTGIGKTVSTLFPAIKAMGAGMGRTIFYLTAKTIARSVAEDTLKLLMKRGLRALSITLTAKDKLCSYERKCNPDGCPRAKGHFDRVNDAVYDILTGDAVVSRDIIIDCAERHCVCPYEMQLDASEWTDCVVCDYNYVYDPRAHLRRYFDFGGDYTILIDEAHNLVDRAREMFSAELTKRTVMDAQKIIKPASRGLERMLAQVNKYFIELRKKYKENQIDQPDDLQKLIRSFVDEYESFLSSDGNFEIKSLLIDFYFTCLSFLYVYDIYDEFYVTYVVADPKDVRIKLFCADPSNNLKQVNKKCRSTTFFSATLLPIDYYKELLCGESDNSKGPPVKTIKLASPFPPENLQLSIDRNISTRYKDRQDSYKKIILRIKEAVRVKNGNYFIFFPSFAYMQAVYQEFTFEYPDEIAIIQSNSMTEREREDFLAAFIENPPYTMTAFAVMGGIFSEGIDLVGERLSGAVIVGVGLPQLEYERDIIREYYSLIKRGYEYAYMYPGFNRVLQAAGRVIRSETDTGFVLLLDDRFAHRRYIDLFPNEWRYKFI